MINVVPKAGNSSAAPQGRPEDEQRCVILNDQSLEQAGQFCNNAITTSQYTPITFLPKFLFYSFTKLANAYFLVVSIMQCIPEISNTNGVPTTLPFLTFIIFIDGVLQVLEDLERHRADEIANNTPCEIFEQANPDGTFIDSKWVDVRVGAILKIKCKEQIPADVLLLHIVEAGKQPESCFVETKNLDGETNLKSKVPPAPTTETIYQEKDLHVLEGQLECETPNKFTNRFTGTLRMTHVPPPIPGLSEHNHVCSIAEPVSTPIDLTSVLLRGSTLQSSDFVYGMVINTGVDTKIMQSMAKPKIKISSVDKQINGLICWVLALLVVLCFVGTIGNSVWNSKNLKASWYLQWQIGDASAEVNEGVITYFYYLLMASTFIAVSLYVSMNMVKFIQRYFMQQDIEMYHEPSDTPMQVRTMNLNEELGMITHVFSDKTGTLTDNVMDFRKCSINGTAYGRGSTEIGIARLRREGKLDEIARLERHAEDRERNKSRIRPVPYVNFDSPEMLEALKGMHGEEQQEKVLGFFIHLALCHTVVVDYDEPKNIKISAASPDESALVAGAIFVGVEFKQRVKDVVTVGVSRVKRAKRPGKPDKEEIVEEQLKYAVLHTLEFTSARKRMSVLLRKVDEETGEHFGNVEVLTKGADNIMWRRLNTKGQEQLIKETDGHVTAFADDGLRTLVIAKKEMVYDEYLKWSIEFEKACSTVSEMQKKRDGKPNLIDELQDEIEGDLEVLGATALEDKLQYKVPATISDMSRAGIHTWMLTGDKEETAINIAHACLLLDDQMNTVVINTKSHPTLREIKHELVWAARRAERAKAMHASQRGRLNAASNQVRPLNVGPNSVNSSNREGSDMSKKSNSDSSTNGASSPDGAGTAAPLRQFHRRRSGSVLGALFSTSQEHGLVIDGDALGLVMGKGLIGGNASGPPSKMMTFSKNLTFSNKPDDKELTAKVQLDDDSGCQAALLRYAQHCRAVVACRCAPAQKSELVQLVRKNVYGARTLAIGDGANDVSMIQAAHVGIGISGHEGLQAVNSSDFAIAQFRFLRRLLLVHGRHNYRRISALVLYLFYKNVLMVMTQYWFTMHTGMSGQKFNPEFGTQMFNLVWTSLPIVTLAVIDKDQSDVFSTRYPQLYGPGIKATFFNSRVIAKWLIEAMFESLCITFLTLSSLPKVSPQATDPDLWYTGAHTFTLVVVICNLKLFLHQYRWHKLQLALVSVCIILWWPSCMIGSLPSVSESSLETFVMGWNSLWPNVQGQAVFWLLLIFVPVAALFPLMALSFAMRQWQPDFNVMCQEVEKFKLAPGQFQLQWELPHSVQSAVELPGWDDAPPEPEGRKPGQPPKTDS